MNRDGMAAESDGRTRAVPLREDGDEPMGGDPACWLHLFEDEEEEEEEEEKDTPPQRSAESA